MRTRFGVSKYLGNGWSVYQSFTPNRIPRPSGGGMVASFFIGAALFLFFCLIVIAAFG